MNGFLTLPCALISALACLAPIQSTNASEIFSPAIVTAQSQHAHPHEQRPQIQIAILLDNSGSMTGLIEQAKSQIWSLVNEFTHAKHNGLQPELHVSIITYGDPPPQMRLLLSTDLDRVSQELFGIKISGGTEYCGQVIQHAIDNLEWSTDKNALKVIFIAGNEPFTQGPKDYREACEDAASKGIIVNTIHCGNGIPAGWRDGALIGKGKAMSIDHNKTVVHVATPYDKHIHELNIKLNTTYIHYGKAGKKRKDLQVEQDANAKKQSIGSSIQRSVSKANIYYNNRSWDMVDACKDNWEVLKEAKEEELPAQLKNKTFEQQKSYIEEQRQTRIAIQKQINDFNEKRNTYLAKQSKESGKSTLNDAMKASLVKQAEGKGYTFKK